MKRISAGSMVVLVLMAALALMLTGCGGGSGNSTSTTPESTSTTLSTPTSLDASSTTTAPAGEGQTFTLAQLAEFDGKDGRAAYVAVDGVVYDVSDGPDWQGGEHTRCQLGAMAGNDLSGEIEQAPSNMRALLDAMPRVGALVQ